MVAADARTAITFSLSPGQAHDAPEGRKLLNRLGQQHGSLSLIMDRAYEGNETRQLALVLGYEPVVPPLRTRVEPWEYDREMYKRRNEIERLFRRLKGFRRIFSLFEKLDVVFLGFMLFVSGQSEPYLSGGPQCGGGSWMWCPRAEGKGS